ncbi:MULTISPECIES: GAF and ANTAR domain-containing protein [Agromyces]|uniref:GAF and ANTAR domain-containing protein n=1 Tax=Agromyces indicus TaxID=758919 RepID=A0ABU1FNG8_9MICO|nr:MULTISPECIES: GAF and ANTAR domain-containing protein [Agromyces]MCK8610668.1 GAF and ANTAR domain-containing protein [Agromyces sp. C10]MDR5692857.1 GAF and ANTAR domain-containing protein [Agromyces indicus]
MTKTSRQERLLEVFATLADTLVDDYDTVELLQMLVESCQELLDVSAVGLLLADADGNLEVMASTGEDSELVETIQLAAEDGPCIEAFRTTSVVHVPDIASAPERWRGFKVAALHSGFASAYGIPMRLREETIGSLNLLRTEPGELNRLDLRTAQALADVATIGILHERALRASDLTRRQLQLALNSRVTIEQAKGVLAHTHDISPEEAFGLLRTHARSHSLPLGVVAERVVHRELIF